MNQKLLTQRLEQFAAEHNIPGLAVRAVNTDGVVFEANIGHRDPEQQLPVTGETYFGLASVTKSFIGLLLVSLEKDGLLSLDDPVTKYVPTFSYPGLDARPPVLVQHLVSHTSGIPPLRGLDYALEYWQRDNPLPEYNDRDYTDAPDVHTVEAFLAYLREGEGPLLGDPGEYVSYSNDTYAVAGALIEAVTGKSLEAALQERVLQPLSLHRITFDTQRVEGDDDAAVLYTPSREGEIVRSPTWDKAPAYDAAGFLKASANDLAEYLRFYLSDGSGLGLSENELAKTHSEIAWAAPGRNYGLGWVTERSDREFEMITHGGSLTGVSSYIGYVPSKGVGAVVLTNLDDLPTRRIWQLVINAMLGRPLDEAPYSIDASTRVPATDLVGSFVNGEPWGRMQFVQDGDNVMVKRGEHGEDGGIVMLLDSGEFFFDAGLGVWEGGRVHRDEGGNIVSLQCGMRWYNRTKH